VSSQDYVVIIQARMGSKRFPGKTLATLAGKPVITHLLESILQAVPNSAIWIATSKNPEDDAIEQFANEKSVKVLRGDSEDVAASRFLKIAAQTGGYFFIRISGDSPLFDHRVLRQTLETMKNPIAEIVTTVSSQPFPSGMNVEAVRCKTFVDAYKNFSKPEHFEHVTRFFYENKEKHVIHYLEWDHALRPKFSFDTQEDKAAIESILASMNRPHYDYTLEEKCKIYERVILNSHA
jgi:spore coat polysaccharide biosynthesis protein SpsF (cytidylyltransferase family)